MKRYSSGLYARLGFAVAIFSNPDIVLVDEVLAVGDAAFRRRALEALRRLIAEGKTVLFISHDMWNVRRLCSEILWRTGGCAYRPAGDIWSSHNEVNSSARQPATRAASHRGGTGELRYVRRSIDAAGRPATTIAPGDARRRATSQTERAVGGPCYDRTSTLIRASSSPRRRRRGRRPQPGWPRRGRVPLPAPAASRASTRAAAVDYQHRWRPTIVTAGPRLR
jgi:ATPase subunit of ABC transporter with duplicated ATPase domains